MQNSRETCRLRIYRGHFQGQPRKAGVPPDERGRVSVADSASRCYVVLYGVLQSCFSSSGSGSTNNCNILVALTRVCAENGYIGIGSRTDNRPSVFSLRVCVYKSRVLSVTVSK